jgi:hypothetical protein
MSTNFFNGWLGAVNGAGFTGTGAQAVSGVARWAEAGAHNSINAPKIVAARSAVMVMVLLDLPLKDCTVFANPRARQLRSRTMI